MTTTENPINPIGATLTPSGVRVEFSNGTTEVVPFSSLSATALVAAEEMLIESGAASWLPLIGREEEDALWASFVPA